MRVLHVLHKGVLLLTQHVLVHSASVALQGVSEWQQQSSLRVSDGQRRLLLCLVTAASSTVNMTGATCNATHQQCYEPGCRTRLQAQRKQ